MSLRCPVSTCRRDMPGHASICGACRADLSRALADVPWLAAELETTLTRQTSRTTSGRAAQTPLMFDARASKAASLLRSVLAGWSRVMLEGWTAPHGPACGFCAHASCVLATGPRNTPASMAAWLSARLPALVRHPAAQEITEELTAAVWAAERAVDRPGERRFAGRCLECGAGLYAVPGASIVQCRECEAAAVGVDKQRAQMLAAVEDQLVTAAMAADILTHLAAPLKAELVRKWAERGRLVPHGTDVHGHPVYRVSDVLQLLVDKLQRDEERRAKREAERAESDAAQLAEAG